MNRPSLMAKSFVLLSCVLLLKAHPNGADAQTAQQIAKRAFESTALLVFEDANGQPVSLGSGFFVRDGEIATNLHVVEGASKGYAKVVGQKTKYNIEGTTAIDPERDLVLLRIPGVRAVPLSLGNSDAVEVGDPIYAVGNPQGLEGTFSQGIVSSVRQVGADKLFQITAPISPGSSGGPVLNSKGEIVGVSVGTFRGGQNLNFAIPSNYLKAMLGKTHSTKPLGGLKSLNKQRSILADLGGRNTEGVVVVQFAWYSPGISSGYYSLSLRNQLRENVKNVYCLVVFYDSQKNPIDVDLIQCSDLIPGGLAKRVTDHVHSSVQDLAERGGSVEFRILDLQIVE